MVCAPCGEAIVGAALCPLIIEDAEAEMDAEDAAIWGEGT